MEMARKKRDPKKLLWRKLSWKLISQKQLKT